MQELQIKVNAKPGVITFNKDEIKEVLTGQMEVYKNLPVSAENRTERKKDIATLRKIKTAVNDRRKEVKAAWLKPYESFDSQVSELIGLIDEPIDLLNDQVKELENAEKKEKREQLTAFFQEEAGNLREWLAIEQVYEHRWENATCTLRAAKNELRVKLKDIRNNLSILEASTSDAKEQAVNIYIDTLDLSESMKYINQYEMQAERIRKAEEERRKREQEEALEAERQRIREEERRRIREEEEIKQQAMEEGRNQAREEVREEVKEEVMEEITKPITDELVTDAKVSAIYVVSANPAGLEELEMLMDSIGIIWERRAL